MIRTVLMITLQVFRLICYKTIAFCRQCRNLLIQMSLFTSAQTFVTSLSRSKKIFVVLLIVCALILYAWPSWLTLGNNRIGIDPLSLCIDSKLHTYRHGLEHFDVLINDSPSQTNKQYLPFVGNGYIGGSVDTQSCMYIKYGRALSTPLNYYPVVSINIEGLQTAEAQAILLRDGMVYKTQCFEIDSLCVDASSQFYAHQVRPSILIQEIRIRNPTETPITADLEKMGLSGWTGATSTAKRVASQGGEVEYTVTTGSIPVEESSHGLVFMVAIASIKVPQTVTVLKHETWKYTVITSVKYTEQPVSTDGQNSDKQYLATEAEKSLKEALGITPKLLREEHTKAWSDLWSSGFGISTSKAVDAVNGDKINSTIYYVMSNLPSPIHELGRTKDEKVSLQKLLYFPDRCYDGHHTLQNKNMWPSVNSNDDLIKLVKMWIITLEKQGCAKMLQAGADGAIQGMILSFGALKFANDHLEFGTPPRDLHRDYFFRRINYGNNTHVNITVIVGEDNKAVLYAALDKSDKHYFACDAGCLDPPIQLRKEVQQFPVKKTEPPTPVLYITSDKQHMEELKHSIHVSEIIEAPAHEHHVIALHRHGHHYGGLPMLFWISIGALITIFHLFLFKLVFNEYCQGPETRYVRSRYNL